MAVLHLLLQGNPKALSISELADVVSRYNAWGQGRRFLMVPFHMIDARDMETAVLGQYAAHVAKLHPEAPVPGFFAAAGLFEDAKRLRATMGDTAFFASLGASKSGDGWGALGTGWDAASFERAIAALPRDPDRTRLVGDLIQSHFQTYRWLATAGNEAFIPFDDGLAVISRHAATLGYDMVVLFLDELILWLASRAADMDFVAREGAKLVKLVEAQSADRPIPLVSFIARQRDLRELVGTTMPGADRLRFADVLQHWEARFARITLEDRNLPLIAQKRVLRPRSDEAKRRLEESFDQIVKMRQEVLDTLLTDHYGIEDFRRVYPFSPALVDTLVAVSSALQRERTAIKLLVQLLVDRRDELELGSIVSVGDLFDVIAEGDEPFSDAMRGPFENAKKLWQQKLAPLLEQQHGVRLEAIMARNADPTAARGFVNDGRILKTLLLAALVPEVPPLKALTAGRIAALNHGTLRSPIPGQEKAEVLHRLRHWAADLGEIRLTGDDHNPIIAIQLTGVDTESIIQNARAEDNDGNRRRKIKELLFEAIGIDDRDSFFAEYEIVWKGTRRRGEVVYDNVREITDDALRPQNAVARAVIDFPFDRPGYSARDDLARLDRFVAGESPPATVVWLPSFLSQPRLDDLGRLVILDHLLTGERFERHAAHLPPVDRVQARALLDNQRSQLRQRLIQSLEVAFGIANEPRDAVAPPLLDPDEHVRSLDPSFAPRPPVGASLRAGFGNILDQLFRHLYPAHPDFAIELKPSVLKRVQSHLERAIATKDGRVEVEREQRAEVRQVVNPLRLAEMHEVHLVMLDHWKTHFLRKHAQAGGIMTVRALRDWLDDPRPSGLTTEVQNLVILAFAAQTNRSFVRRGVVQAPTLDWLDDDLELAEQRLPDEMAWAEGVRRAQAIFSIEPPERRSATTAARLAQTIKTKVEALDAVKAYGAALAKRQAELGIHDVTERAAAQGELRGLLEAVQGAPEGDVIEIVAEHKLSQPEIELETVLARAAQLTTALDAAPWEIVGALGTIDDARKPAADTILADLRDALSYAERAVALAPKLKDIAARTAKLLARRVEAQPAPRPEPRPDGQRLIQAGDAEAVDAAGLAAEVAKIQALLDCDTLRRASLSWRVVEPGGHA